MNIRQFIGGIGLVAVLFAFHFPQTASLQAQENDGVIYPNSMFGSVHVGAYGYVHESGTYFSAPSVGVAGGFWVADPLAVQLSLDGIIGSRPSGNSAVYLFLNTDFKWDANSTFFHVYNKNYLSPIPVYPIFGIGMGTCLDFDSAADSDYAFTMSVGFEAPYRISDKTDVMLQYKCYFMPVGFDNGGKTMHTFGVGFNFRQSNEPFHRRTERSTRAKGEDWFFGVGIGPNYSSFDLFTNPNHGGLAMVGVAPEVMVGRNFSNFWTLRVQVAGLTGHELYDTLHATAGQSYRFSYAHADLMFNLSSLIWRQRGASFNIMPYFGAGPVWRYDRLSFSMGADAGLFLRQYITRRSDLYLDMRYLMVPPYIGGSRGPSDKFYGVGLPSVTVGYIYNFGHNTTRYRIPLTDLRH